MTGTQVTTTVRERGARPTGWDEYRVRLSDLAAREERPVSGTFELTPLCNFNCRMCYVHLTPERMRERGRLRTTEEWLDMARQVRDAGVLSLTLTGGEILTRPDFLELYRELSDMGFVLSLLTNGSLVDDEVLAELSNRPPMRMRITLYGASNETYERLCGVSGMFDRVLDNCRRLLAAGIPLSLAFTRTTENERDEGRVRELADELGVTLRSARAIVNGVRGAENEADALRVGTPPPVEPEGALYGVDPAVLPTNPFTVCAGYHSSFWIDWDGSMELCAFMDHAHARPFEAGFERAWREMNEALDRIRLPGECVSCVWRPHCLSCPGMREADAGSPERVCSWHCAVAAERAHVWRRGGEAATKGGDACEEAICDA